jgi:hypothetical protein
MDENKQTDDRWRELADLLGLPEERPAVKSEPAPAPRPVEMPPPRHEPRREEAEAPVTAEREELPESLAEPIDVREPELEGEDTVVDEMDNAGE